MHEDWLHQVDRLWVKKAQNTFPFEKELALFQLKCWILWPPWGPRRADVARLLGAIVTLHRLDKRGRLISGRIKSIADLQRRFKEPWCEEFYQTFYSLFDGIGSLSATRRPSQIDAATGIITPTICRGQRKRLGPRSPYRWSYRWSNNTSAVHCLRNILKLLVADAVLVEPVSTPKFPANREINREFRQIRSLC
jgi:hypothetical protein